MEKINLVELLKDCPKGMELDCAMFEGVLEFDSIVDNEYLPIRCRIKNPNGGYNDCNFTKDGCWTNASYAKCVIFPKGKTTWEGFQRPFKDGDIVCYMDAIAIFKEWGDETLFRTYVATYLCCDPLIDVRVPFYGKSVRKEIRLATEKEKEKLFQVIKDNGYKWNVKTKTLEKLIVPKFKVGDRIKNSDNCRSSIVVKIKDDCFIIKTLDGLNNSYLTDKLSFSKQDEWELVPNKFDITTFKPFDKVLVRCSSLEKWRIQFFEKYDKTCKFPFICMGYNKYKQCIPYEGNEHLLDTADSCSDYYLI